MDAQATNKKKRTPFAYAQLVKANYAPPRPYANVCRTTSGTSHHSGTHATAPQRPGRIKMSRSEVAIGLIYIAPGIKEIWIVSNIQNSNVAAAALYILSLGIEKVLGAS